MKPGRTPLDEGQRERLRAELHRDVAQRRQGYRTRALEVLPHVCARCAREFSGKRLRELTVHHRDHNFKNNPPDGSNWELLCLYCHDHEHEKGLGGQGPTALEPDDRSSAGVFQPFAGLDSLFKPGGDAPREGG